MSELSVKDGNGSEAGKGTAAAAGPRAPGAGKEQEKQAGGAGDKGQAAGAAMDKIKEGIEGAPAKIKEGLTNAVDQVEQGLAPAGDWMRETVRGQPLALIGATLGAGLCLGFAAGCLVGVFALRPKGLAQMLLGK